MLICQESKTEWLCNISMTKYSKYESDRLWSIKMNGIDYGRWNKNEWDGLWYVNTTKMEWW